MDDLQQDCFFYGAVTQHGDKDVRLASKIAFAITLPIHSKQNQMWLTYAKLGLALEDKEMIIDIVSSCCRVS